MIPPEPTVAQPVHESTGRGDGTSRRRRRQRRAENDLRPTYYGVPAIHKPHWKWLIVSYFFLGGISGGSYAIAAISERFGRRGDASIARAGRYLAFITLLPCPVLLILDLGRPERFLHMLRVVKFRSPMSTGTWGLLLYSSFSFMAALGQASEDGLLNRSRRRGTLRELPTGAIAAAGTPLGFFISGYTGILLGATAVPLWTKRAFLLGPLFLASSMSTSAAAISGILTVQSGTDPDVRRRIGQLEAFATVAELGLLTTWLYQLGPTGDPLRKGSLGRLLRFGTVGAGLLAPLALRGAEHVFSSRFHKSLRLTGSILVLAGGFLFRYAIVVAGHASADDPRATLDLAGAPRSEPESYR